MQLSDWMNQWLTSKSGKHGWVGIIEMPRPITRDFPLWRGLDVGGGIGVRGCGDVREGRVAWAGGWGVNVNSVRGSTCTRHQWRVTCAQEGEREREVRSPAQSLLPPGEKRSGEWSQIPWAYYPKVVMTNEIARLVIITLHFPYNGKIRSSPFKHPHLFWVGTLVTKCFDRC